MSQLIHIQICPSAHIAVSKLNTHVGKRLFFLKSEFEKQDGLLSHLFSCGFFKYKQKCNLFGEFIAL